MAATRTDVKDGKTVEIPCPLCAGGDYVTVLRSRETITEERTHFCITRCRTCGHYFTNPRPTPAELRRYYAPQYWVVSSRALDLGSLKLAGQPWRVTMRQHAEPILRHKKSGSLLEIGCGDGLFLYYLREQGWSVRGVEPGASAARFARNNLKLDVFSGPLEEFDPKGERFDIVYLHHVLEHMDSPMDVLQRARSLLKKEGLVIVVVPSYASCDRRLFGPYWRGLSLPLHLHHFTPGRLKELFRGVGLTPIDTRFFSNSGVWPVNYSDSIRVALQELGLKKRTAVVGPLEAPDHKPAATPGEVLSTGRPLIDFAHRIEYALFRSWGNLMDRVGLGSSVMLIGSKAN